MVKNIKCLDLLSKRFSGSLATKCISLNNEPCLVRPTGFDLNPDNLFRDSVTIHL